MLSSHMLMVKANIYKTGCPGKKQNPHIICFIALSAAQFYKQLLAKCNSNPNPKFCAFLLKGTEYFA